MPRQVVKTDKAPAPVAAYSQGILAQGKFVFVSGQFGTDPTTDALAEGVAAQTEFALQNLPAIVEAAGSSLAKVVKVTVLLHDINDFSTMNAVYMRFFPNEQPARMAFGGLDLPKGALVEIECIALVED